MVHKIIFLKIKTYFYLQRDTVNKKLIFIACVMVVLPAITVCSENEPYSAEATKGGAAKKENQEQPEAPKKTRQQNLSDKLKPLYNPQGLAGAAATGAMLGAKRLIGIGLVITGIAYNEVIVEAAKGALEQCAKEWKQITTKNL